LLISIFNLVMSDSLKTLKIFMKDSPKTDNKYNKYIFEFLNNNISNILECGYYIRIILLNSSNIEQFMKLNISNVPALYDDTLYKDNVSITGAEDIIKYIIYKCDNDADAFGNKKPQPTAPEQFVSDDERSNDLRNYLLTEVLDRSNDTTMEDPIDKTKADVFEKAYYKNKEKFDNKKNLNRNFIKSLMKNNENTSYEVSNGDPKINNLSNPNDAITKTKKISSHISDEDEALKKFWENQETT